MNLKYGAVMMDIKKTNKSWSLKLREHADLQKKLWMD